MLTTTFETRRGTQCGKQTLALKTNVCVNVCGRIEVTITSTVLIIRTEGYHISNDDIYRLRFVARCIDPFVLPGMQNRPTKIAVVISRSYTSSTCTVMTLTTAVSVLCPVEVLVICSWSTFHELERTDRHIRKEALQSSKGVIKR
jgi:hypothetical protein